MYLKSLRLQNFLSHKDSKMDFESPMSMSIVGQNGAGKSSIIEGIYYALTGKILRSATLADVTSNGAEYHHVEIRIIHHEVEYEIIREYHKNNNARKKHVLVRTRPAGTEDEWEVISTRSASADWNASEVLFGLDSESLRNTVIIGQNDIDGLSTLTPGERRSLLIDLLFEGKTIQKVNKQLQSALKQTNQQIGELTSRKLMLMRDVLTSEDEANLLQENVKFNEDLHALESSLMNFHKHQRYIEMLKIFDEMQVSPSDFSNNIGWFFANVKPQVETFQNKVISERRALEAEIAQLRERYTELKKQADDIPSVEAEISRYAGIKEEIAKLTTEKEQLIATRARLEQVFEIDLESQGNCPVCGQVITGDEAQHVKEYRKKAKAEHRQTEKRLKEIVDLLVGLESKESILNRRTERLNYLKTVVAPELSRVTNSGKILREKTAPANAGAFKKELLGKSRLKSVIQSEQYKPAMRSNRLMNAVKEIFPDFNIQEAKILNELYGKPVEESAGDENQAMEIGNVQDAETRITQMRNTVAKNLLSIEQSQKSKALLSEIENSLETYRAQAEIDNMLMSVLSIRDGAPAMALDESLHQISQIATSYAVNLADDVTKVEFISRKQNLGGDEVPTLEIQITKRDGVISYGSLSGGERVKIAFAIRVAISAMLLSSKNIQFFIIDEAMASLDQVSRQRLVALLQKMNIPQIFVITHLEDVANMYPTVAYVQKDSTQGSIVSLNSHASLSA